MPAISTGEGAAAVTFQARSSIMTRHFHPSFRRAGKEDEIPIRIDHDESSRSPRLFLECLRESNFCGLVAQKELPHLIRARDGDRSRKQMLALADIAREHSFADHPQVKSCIVATDLPVKRRIAVDEFDREAELVCIEIAGTLDVRDEELCRD